MYDANTDRNSVIVNTLIQPIEARFVRVYPETWNGHISMRMDLYGCEIQSGKNLVCDVTNINKERLNQWRNSVRLFC